MKYFIQTLGCQMNASDTERLCSVLDALNMAETKDEDEAELYLFNTCSIKQKAEDKVFGKMIDLRKRKPHVQVGLFGCMAKKTSVRSDAGCDPLFARMKDLDFVFRTEDMQDVPSLLAKIGFKTKNLVEYFDDYLSVLPRVRTKKSVFVPIQTGCNKFCTYCVVPFTRGTERNRKVPDILQEVKTHIVNGASEITLLGQTVNSYISDDGVNFSQLLEMVAKCGAKRVRFTSPYPTQITRELVEVIARHNNICKHIHMPVQAGSNEVLRRMNRRYTREEYLERIQMIRSLIPDIAITTDIIVGFCGETREQFEETVALYREVEFDFCFVSKYSLRRGTAAHDAFSDDVPPTEKARRWHKLNNLMAEIGARKYQKLVGSVQEVMIEKISRGVASGRTMRYDLVQFPADDFAVGDVVNVRCEKAHEYMVASIVV